MKTGKIGLHIFFNLDDKKNKLLRLDKTQIL